MAIFEAGSLNLSGLVVPDLYVQVLPPSLLLLNGVPTSRIGFVGTATWGPVGVPVPVGSYPDQVREFGPLQGRAFDMGTAVALAIQQGAQNMLGVRVTDGTDVAASATVQTNCLTLTARWTGTRGNAIAVSFAPGSRASTTRVTVAQAGSGRVPEVFDNIAGTGNALWVAIAAAINAGIPGQRSASDLVVAAAGAGVTAPATATVTLAGGLDGAAGVTASTLLGSDAVPRTGLYAMRGTGVSVAALCDATDTSTWAAQVAFGLFEGCYMMLQGAAGQTVSAAATAKNTAGVDTRAAKVILGDWLYWQDPTTGVLRMVSPQGVFAGRLGNLSPHLSGLNKPVYGVVATQRSMTGAPYSAAELTVLAQAGIDVIANPCPGGAYFGIRMGCNASSLASESGDNSTRMTNFLAATFNAGLGRFVGEPTSDESLRASKATLDAFLADLRGLNMIEDWAVTCGPSNNPPNRRALGYRTADAKVRYLPITRFFVTNLEGSQATTIDRAAA